MQDCSRRGCSPGQARFLPLPPPETNNASISYNEAQRQSAQQAAAYEVNRIDSRTSRFESVPGEIIVKLKTSSSSSSPARLRAKNGKVSSSSSTLESFLTSRGLQEAEPLMTLTGPTVSRKPARGYNGKPVADSDLSGLYVLKFDSKTRSGEPTGEYELIEELKALDDVEYAEPNYLVRACADTESYTSDPMYSQQWGPSAIGLDKLWGVTSTQQRRQVIAILDTGVDITHPDLAANIWTNTVEADGADNRDDDGNGYKDDIHGWDFVNKSAKMRDNNGHGTHCAGIAAAVGGNGIGITGANPDALVMPVAVLQSNGTGDIATIIKGIDYAAANGADVISMSFGTYAESLALTDALGKAYQKCVLVAAAGNDNLCIKSHLCPVNKMYGAPMFPAAISFVLGVEASGNAAGELAGFSNYDDDGPVTSSYSQLYNYELRAPGTSVMSTFPGGQYRALNGTSMACPLAAGAISRLMACRESSSKEELFGDLIHTAHGNMDIFTAYSLTDTDRKPTLALQTYRLDDAKMGDGDGRPDAGETIRLYPTFRNAWGNARNIRYKLRLHELEDPDILEFIDEGYAHSISNLSSYATAEGENPLVFKISPDCADGRVISLELVATCDNMTGEIVQSIPLTVENCIELKGYLEEDMTLYPDKNYRVTAPGLVILEDVTLKIMPGAKIDIADGGFISTVDGLSEVVYEEINGKSFRHTIYPHAGRVIAIGTPGNMIEITGLFPNGGPNGQFSYCKFYNVRRSGIAPSSGSWNGSYTGEYFFNNCIVDYIYDARYGGLDAVEIWNGSPHLELFGKNNFTRQYTYYNPSSYNNSINNRNYYGCDSYIADGLKWNIFSNYGVIDGIYSFLYNPSSAPTMATIDIMPYVGTSSDEKAHYNIVDFNRGWGTKTLKWKELRTRPYSQAHGIVWKVVVNDYDAQDEYEWLAPLGVGRHKFEVYFNREMNHAKTPFIAMGVREPYTQTAIAEDGEWRTEEFDGEKVDIYTAYLTIKGKDNFDGVNTIYVSDAEDDEYFEIPIEDVRFHVNVQSAGSMSSGFTAEPGVGKVTLTWENPEENFDDMLGYNMYRYTLDADDNPTEAVRINETLLTDETLTDYDIVPGTTYCYYYKVLRTSLDENAPSKVVAATPRAAGKGDANGSGDVDVADIVAEVAYMTGGEPKPFIFDAADVNGDAEVDILDVVGTVNIIMAPAAGAASVTTEAASWSVEDGILWIDSPVAFSGVQVELKGNSEEDEIAVLDALKGMETTGSWVAADHYRFLAFSLSGKSLEAGKHALLRIGGAKPDAVKLVAPNGKEIMTLAGETTGISSVMGQQMLVPTPNPFRDTLSVPVKISGEGTHDVRLALTSLGGAEALVLTKNMGYGEETVTLDTSAVLPGFYLLTLTVDGKNVQTCKVVKL